MYFSLNSFFLSLLFPYSLPPTIPIVFFFFTTLLFPPFHSRLSTRTVRVWYQWRSIWHGSLNLQQNSSEWMFCWTLVKCAFNLFLNLLYVHVCNQVAPCSHFYAFVSSLVTPSPLTSRAFTQGHHLPSTCLRRWGEEGPWTLVVLLDMPLLPSCTSCHRTNSPTLSCCTITWRRTDR